MPTATTRVCAITGGSAGIGLATALRFRAAGYSVAICGRDATKLQAAERQILKANTESDIPAGVLSWCGDIGQPGGANEYIVRITDALGRLDVLVNNAGHAALSSIESYRDVEFDHLMNINVRAVFEAVRAAWPRLRETKQGTIVNVSSRAAVDPFPGFSVYGATKAWVELFTQAIAQEGVQDGIAAYCVRPGAVETSMLRDLFPKFPPSHTLEPRSVAELIWKLCDPAMRFSSGSVIPIQKR